MFSETLPRSGMTLNGTLYLLPPLVHLIYATGCGSSPLLPTPCAADGKDGASGDLYARFKDVGRQRGKASLLPTPPASDSKNAADYSDGSRGHSPQLRHLGTGLLNPRFVESMMRLPNGWTELP